MEKFSEKWFIFHEDKLLLLKQSEKLILPNKQDLKFCKTPWIRLHALGLINGIDCYCAESENDLSQYPQAVFTSLKQSYIHLGQEWFYGAAKGFQIINWDKNHQYCGRCGNNTVLTQNRFERKCETCSHLFYPKISPSIIVRITKKYEILMARSPHFPPGVYGLIAGFVEPGENLEEAVKREVLEEVGISIKNIRYFGSQAWPFPDVLMLAFTAEHEAGEIVIDQNEIENAGWFDAHHLPGFPSFSFSIAKALIDDFIGDENNLEQR